MKLAHPLWLGLLVLLPLFWWLEQRVKHWRRQASLRFAAEPFHRELWPWALNPFIGWATGLWTLAYVLIVLAVARPQGAPLQTLSTQRSMTVFFVVDYSLSMLAQDCKPDRLSAARETVLALLEHMPNDRVGLVGFAGEAQVVCPLTNDADALRLALLRTRPTDWSPPGSNPQAGINLALDKLAPLVGQGKALILLSDGEENITGDWSQPGERARQLGIKLFSLGVGTISGARIPIGKDFWGNPLYRVYQGKPVRTRLTSLGLRKSASLSGGKYFTWGEAPSELVNQLMPELRKIPRDLAKTAPILTYVEYFPWLVGMAFILLLWEALLWGWAGVKPC